MSSMRYVPFTSEYIVANYLFGWGSNITGVSPNPSSRSPIRIAPNNDWVSIDAYSYNGAGIKSDGTLWTWGPTDYGQLGRGVVSTNVPADKLIGQVGVDTDWAMVSIGPEAMLAIKKNGTLWTWGGNRSGQLGIGSTDTSLIMSTPIQIGTDSNWATCSASNNTARYAIKTDGTLWVWGNNFYGALGTGKTQNAYYSPTQSGLGQNWASVSGGTDCAAAITTDGTMCTAGRYILARTSGTAAPAALFLPITAGGSWKMVAVGSQHVLAIDQGGALYAWGDNSKAQVGNGSTSAVSQPVYLDLGEPVIWCAASTENSFAITQSGKLYGWGNNNGGAVGNGSTANANISKPSRIPGTTVWAMAAPSTLQGFGIGI